MLIRVRHGNKVNQCISIKVICGGLEVRALVDTGCMVNVVYKGAYEKMGLREGQEEEGSRELWGIGNIAVLIISKFRECIEIGGMKMMKVTFMCCKVQMVSMICC